MKANQYKQAMEDAYSEIVALMDTFNRKAGHCRDKRAHAIELGLDLALSVLRAHQLVASEEAGELKCR